MKRLAQLSAAAILLVATPAVAGSIRVQNGDSKVHTIELKCSGSSKTVELKASTTSTYTFHSTHKSCDIVGGTITFPVKVLEDGQAWTIKDGKAKKS
ncbi:MAG: hypothetical protein R2939_08615 [Kofleriaceae bacterium]